MAVVVIDTGLVVAVAVVVVVGSSDINSNRSIIRAGVLGVVLVI